MVSFDNPQLCTKCQGYKTMPYSWNSTAKPRMCSCPKVSLSWECHRCGKINAPWKGSCDCTPTPFGNLPITGGVNDHTSGSTQLNKYLIDERGQFDFGKLPDPFAPKPPNI